MTVDPERLLLLASGVGQLLVAALALALAPGRPLHRAFAGLLAARGLTSLLPAASSDPAWAWAATNMQPYFSLAIVPLAIYCLVAAPAWGSRDPPARHGWLAAGAIAVLAAAYWLDHSLYYTLAAGQAPSGALQAAAGIQYTSFGPLVVFGAVAPVVLAALGLRLAVSYRQRAAEPDGPGTTLLLLASGFLLVALFDGASRLAALSALLDDSAGFPWLPWGWTLMALPPLAAVPALLGLAVLAAGRVVPRSRHRLEGLVLALGALAFFSGFLRLLLPASSDPGGASLNVMLLGLWRLSIPVATFLAFLQPSWRAADDHVHEGFAWGTALLAITASGVLAALLLGNWLAAPGPLLATLAVAMAVTTAWNPLARGGRALANAVLAGRAPLEADPHPKSVPAPVQPR